MVYWDSVRKLFESSHPAKEPSAEWIKTWSLPGRLVFVDPLEISRLMLKKCFPAQLEWKIHRLNIWIELYYYKEPIFLRKVEKSDLEGP